MTKRNTNKPVPARPGKKSASKQKVEPASGEVEAVANNAQVSLDEDEADSEGTSGDATGGRPNSKWAEYKLYVEHYRYYLDMTLKANGFFYLTAGGIAGYYLQHSTEPQMKYFLWLPMVAGLVLSGMFFYGAQLWEKGYQVGMRIADALEVTDKNFKELPDLHLLYLYLRFSSILFFIDGMILAAVPLLRQETQPTEWRFYVWIIVSVVLLVSSWFIPAYCRRDNMSLQRRLKKNQLLQQQRETTDSTVEDEPPRTPNRFDNILNWIIDNILNRIIYSILNWISDNIVNLIRRKPGSQPSQPPPQNEIEESEKDADPVEALESGETPPKPE